MNNIKLFRNAYHFYKHLEAYLPPSLDLELEDESIDEQAKGPTLLIERGVHITLKDEEGFSHHYSFYKKPLTKDYIYFQFNALEGFTILGFDDEQSLTIQDAIVRFLNEVDERELIIDDRLYTESFGKGYDSFEFDTILSVEEKLAKLLS